MGFRHPQVVLFPHGLVGANVNLLTTTVDADKLSGMSTVSGIAVDIARDDEASSSTVR